VFFGTYLPRLDDKGRLFLPAKFRDQLAEGLVITKGQEHCLLVFPRTEFDRLTERLREAPMTDSAVRAHLRVLFGSASDEVPDRQGRVTIPPPLRAWARLRRDCAVIGSGSRVEIWDAEAWERYLADREQDFAETAKEVLPGIL
jgi:MraZ protein